jgi:ribonuclease HI
MEEAKILNIPSDYIIPYTQNYKPWTHNYEQYNVFNEARTYKLQIFTDGSHIKTDGQGLTGCGYVLFYYDSLTQKYQKYHEKSIYLGRMATIFQAEMYAIGHATNYVTNKWNSLASIGIEEVDIITDSKAAIGALAGNVIRSKLVSDTIKELNKLGSRAKLAINWIKAHVGHEGNEEADRLAKEGTKITDFTPEPIIPVSNSWIDNQINSYIANEWTWIWQHTNEARQTKIFFPKPDKRKSNKLIKLDRQTYGQAFRWISGHSFHRYHNHLTNPDTYPSSLCKLCKDEKEETHHLYAHCCGLAHLRMRVLGKSYLGQNFEWTPQQLQNMIAAIEHLYPEEKPRCNSNQHLTQPR